MRKSMFFVEVLPLKTYEAAGQPAPIHYLAGAGFSLHPCAIQQP